eukprot:s2538_g32.t1
MHTGDQGAEILAPDTTAPASIDPALETVKVEVKEEPAEEEAHHPSTAGPSEVPGATSVAPAPHPPSPSSSSDISGGAIGGVQAVLEEEAPPSADDSPPAAVREPVPGPPDVGDDDIATDTAPLNPHPSSSTTPLSTTEVGASPSAPPKTSPAVPPSATAAPAAATSSIRRQRGGLEKAAKDQKALYLNNQEQSWNWVRRVLSGAYRPPLVQYERADDQDLDFWLTWHQRIATDTVEGVAAALYAYSAYFRNLTENEGLLEQGCRSTIATSICRQGTYSTCDELYASLGIDRDRQRVLWEYNLNRQKGKGRGKQNPTAKATPPPYPPPLASRSRPVGRNSIAPAREFEHQSVVNLFGPVAL